MGSRLRDPEIPPAAGREPQESAHSPNKNACAARGDCVRQSCPAAPSCKPGAHPLRDGEEVGYIFIRQEQLEKELADNMHR